MALTTSPIQYPATPRPRYRRRQRHSRLDRALVVATDALQLIPIALLAWTAVVIAACTAIAATGPRAGDLLVLAVVLIVLAAAGYATGKAAGR